MPLLHSTMALPGSTWLYYILPWLYLTTLLYYTLPWLYSTVLQPQLYSSYVIVYLVHVVAANLRETQTAHNRKLHQQVWGAVCVKLTIQSTYVLQVDVQFHGDDPVN